MPYDYMKLPSIARPGPLFMYTDAAQTSTIKTNIRKAFTI